MSRFGILWIIWLAASGLLACRTDAATGPSAGPETPGFLGTWHVLIHYQMPDGSHPDRWKWDERVWVIEPSSDGGIEWVEHAIVNLGDPSGRFENLGTNRARRLIGAWEPSEAQRAEIEAGVTVSSRGMRRKRLQRTPSGDWQSTPNANAIGRSSRGVGYRELWSIREDENGTRFEIDARVAVSLVVDDESTGVTAYQADASGPGRFQGSYARGAERAGRFRIVPTRILVPEVRERSILSRPIPTPTGPVQLIPDKRVHSRVPLIVSVLRPFHYYEERKLTIDSTPPGAELDLAYLRRGSQLLYHRGQAPLTVVLPTRLQSSPADRLLIRGFLPGHERTRRSVSVADVDDHLRLELPPLPNRVVGIAHGSLVGRSVLELRTREVPTVRVAEDEAGWTIVLVRTGLSEQQAEQLSSLRDPQLSVDARQLGDDLVVRLRADDAEALGLRHRSLADPARDEVRTRLEIDGPAAPERAARLLAAVGAMQQPAERVCDAHYEGALLAALSDRQLVGQLGRDDHPYRATLRAALRQMAELSPDRGLRTRSGGRLAAGTPLEFELAWSRSAEIDGYLSWLQQLATRIEPTDEGALVFRSLVAPDWSPDRFDALLKTAARARDGCRSGASSS